MRANNIDLRTNTLDFSELRFISDKIVVPASKKLRNGSLLICISSGSKSHLGKVAYIDADYDLAFGGFMGMITPNESINSNYLYRLMLSAAYRDFIEGLSEGININNLKFDDLARFPVPLPTLPEQRRIVALLDEAFAGLETLRANAEKNVQNARELFRAQIDKVFLTKGEGWRDASIGEISIIKGGKRVPKGYKLLSEKTPFPYLRVTDFNDDGSVNTGDLRYIDAAVHKEIKNYIISSSDLYISIAGTIGKTGIVPKELDGANLTENACRLIFSHGVFNRFVYYFTKTTDFYDQTVIQTRTAAQPKLALSRLASIKIGLPSLKEQERLASKFDELKLEIDQISSLYDEKLVAIDDLKQSLLHRAFSGQLIASEAAAA